MRCHTHTHKCTHTLTHTLTHTQQVAATTKETLVEAPDADILAAAIETLRKRIAVVTATFLVKVKAHLGNLANEGADILADKAIFRSESRQRSVPTDKWSSLHVEKPMPQGRKRNLSRLSFDI